MRNRESGFTLIEVVIATAIIGILSGTAIPAYRIYAQKSEMTVAESNLRNGLKYFAAGEEYHPPTGALDELVLQGYLPSIPNDPWTSKAAAVTNTEEVGDWFYSNDGQNILLYALSGKGSDIIMPSLGIAAPGAAGIVAPAVPAAPVSKKASAALKKAANWTAKAAKAQKLLDTLATRLAKREVKLSKTQAIAATNPTKKNKNAVKTAQKQVNSANNSIAKVQKNLANYQAQADKWTAKAATL